MFRAAGCSLFSALSDPLPTSHSRVRDLSWPCCGAALAPRPAPSAVTWRSPAPERAKQGEEAIRVTHTAVCTCDASRQQTHCHSHTIVDVAERGNRHPIAPRE